VLLPEVTVLVLVRVDVPVEVVVVKLVEVPVPVPVLGFAEPETKAIMAAINRLDLMFIWKQLAS
jgi:hypothetical protein